MNDTKGETLPEGWLPQPVNDVNDDPRALNDEQCVVLFGAAATACEALKRVANEYYVAADKDIEAMPMRFFSAPDGGVTGQLRKLTGVLDDKLILLDIASDGAFYVCDKAGIDINEASVKAFLDDFKAGRLERKQLQAPTNSNL